MIEFTSVDFLLLVQIYLLLGGVIVIQTVHGLALRAIMMVELPAALALGRYALLFAVWALECFWLPYYAMRELLPMEPLLHVQLSFLCVLWMFKSLEILLGTFPRGANASAWNWAIPDRDNFSCS